MAADVPIQEDACPFQHQVGLLTRCRYRSKAFSLHEQQWHFYKEGNETFGHYLYALRQLTAAGPSRNFTGVPC